MEKFGVVPTVLDVVPPASIKVVYSDNLIIDNGAEFKPRQLIKPPVEISWHAEEKCYYTFLLVDPDATETPQVRHWLVINIPGNKLNKGETVSPYTGPKPPANSGIHSYVFLVFKQKGKLASQPWAESQLMRHSFNARKYAAEYNLENPIAGNFLTAQADEYSIKFWADRKAKEPVQTKIN